MKGTEHFKACIKNYLDKRAQEDELFRAKYETTTRTIDDVVTYILNEVKASGCWGFSDDEIFGMAVHVIDEPTLEIGKPIKANVVVNHNDFGIVIKDKEIEASVLDSIEAYQAEGDAMHHCVFKCSYFNRDDSIVLSAHDKEGNRIVQKCLASGSLREARVGHFFRKIGKLIM